MIGVGHFKTYGWTDTLASSSLYRDAVEYERGKVLAELFEHASVGLAPPFSFTVTIEPTDGPAGAVRERMTLEVSI